MFPIKNISIPQTCHQSWREMEEKGGGRHCLQCSKTVIDFSKMTNDEILGYLATEKHVCGRFNQFQLSNVNYQLDLAHLPKRLGWKKWLAAAGLLGASFVTRAMAQTTPAATQQNAPDSSRKSDMLGKIAVVDTSVQRIKGVIIDGDDKLPVVGAYVKIKGANIGVQTDSRGRFDLYIGNARPVLVISYIGYLTREVTVSAADTKRLTIVIQPSQSCLGEVVITKSTPQQSRVEMIYQYMPWPINRLFK